MLGRQGDSQGRLMMVDLDQFVPAEHILRRIKAKVDFEFIYDQVMEKQLYKAGGRPTIDPVVLVRMWLIGYLYGITSERRLEQEVHLNLAYRWFLGIPLDKRVPDHSTLSANRNGRFQDGSVTHVKANASDEAREVVTVTKEPREYIQSLAAAAEEVNQEQREKRGGNKRGPKGGGLSSERTEVRSTTDPDAGLLNRPGKPKGFHYLAHLTVEPTYGIVLDAVATPANVTDHEPYVECIRRAKRRHNIREAAADAGYDRAEVHKELADLGITTFTPVVEHHTADSLRYTVKDFSYDPQTDTYQCPAGKTLRFRYVASYKSHKIYAASQRDCKVCLIRTQCLSAATKSRRLKRPFHQEAVDAAHARVGTPRYRELQRLRRVWCEGTNALLKTRYGLQRAMRRGLNKMQEQLLMAVTALNIRRMVVAMA